MRINKSDVEVQMAIPGATLRQHRDFGSAGSLGLVSCEYFTLAAGVDTTPLFIGLDEDACQCPHWGYVLAGQLTTTAPDGTSETVATGDIFYWPAGHNVRVDSDAEIIMFSPQEEHSAVIAHMLDKVNAQG
ncbi:MAG: cupin domain-containing protein [Actinomycetales bacterium]|nr:cupin domain-containing protein [Actinomycetales bacterium]